MQKIKLLVIFYRNYGIPSLVVVTGLCCWIFMRHGPATLSYLLDEPFTHISPIQVEVIQEVIAMEKQGKGFLITDHLIGELKPICDKIYFLDNGKTQLLSQYG